MTAENGPQVGTRDQLHLGEGDRARLGIKANDDPRRGEYEAGHGTLVEILGLTPMETQVKFLERDELLDKNPGDEYPIHSGYRLYTLVSRAGE